MQSFAACDKWRPVKLSITPSEYEALADVCTSLGGSKIALVNTSTVALDVTFPEDRLAARPLLQTGIASSFADAAVQQAVPGECSFFTPSCTLPPGASVFARGTSMSLTFRVNDAATVEVVAARVVGQWVDDRVTAPGRKYLGSIATCAAGIAAAAEHQPWEDAMRNTIATYSSCRGVIQTAEREASTVDRVPAATRTVRLAKRLSGGSWIDALTYGIARLIRR